MSMPVLRPIPIPTRNQRPLVRLKRWVMSVRQWEVVEDWEYQLPGNHPPVVIPAGFVFDGASIPRPLWALLSPIGLLLIPGLIHDFGYRYDYLWATGPSGEVYKYREGVGQKFWDHLFYEVGKAVNGMVLIDALAFAALALAGGFAWRGNRKRAALEVRPNRPIRKAP